MTYSRDEIETIVEQLKDVSSWLKNSRLVGYEMRAVDSAFTIDKAIDALTCDTSYEIVTDEGEWCAESTSLDDAKHYAAVYGQDGPVHIVEVRRRKI